MAGDMIKALYARRQSIELKLQDAKRIELKLQDAKRLVINYEYQLQDLKSKIQQLEDQQDYPPTSEQRLEIITGERCGDGWIVQAKCLTDMPIERGYYYQATSGEIHQLQGCRQPHPRQYKQDEIDWFLFKTRVVGILSRVVPPPMLANL